MKWPFAVAPLLAACAFVGKPSPTPKATPVSCICPPPEPALLEVQSELEACEKKAQIVAQPIAKTRFKTVQTQTSSTPRCDLPEPEIVPVRTVPCGKGRTCLDEKGQLDFIGNTVRYETFFRKYRECGR